MEAKQVALTIRGVALEQESETPLILLGELGGSRVIHVPVGPFEASAIIVEMEGIRPPRPLTHDLFTLLFRNHRLTMDRLEFYGVYEDGFLARIRYHGLFRKYSVEVRPSDGIALALRLRAPIVATEDVIISRPYGPIFLERNDSDTGEILFLGTGSAGLPIV